MTSTLARFIISARTQITAEWERFAREFLPGAGTAQLAARRDHVEGMLLRIAQDLETPQTEHERSDKAKGLDDESATSNTAANAHGSDRAAMGFSPGELIAEFRALRANVLRLWLEAEGELARDQLNDVMRFNEAIDQLLAESTTRYVQGVEKSKDLFLGVLGHDLRNPLGAIMMSATVMMTHEGPDWLHAKTASRILDAGTRMEALIADLVDFTRSRLGGGIPVERANMDLAEIGRLTIDELQSFHPECNVQLHTSGDLHGEWDRNRIGQVLSNLLSNAFQHGADRAAIDVEMRGELSDVVVSVTNQGEPIPPARLREIFDPFKQLEPSSKQSVQAHSVGLGLYIVESIVEAHGGNITVDSSIRGTTFTVRLPRAASADQP